MIYHPHPLSWHDCNICILGYITDCTCFVAEKGGAHPCIVCKAQLDKFLQSRPLPRSHAQQYGLREEEVTPGARVCNTCRCKSVRNRYTQCPLPTCPNAKGRIKRLRPLPGKWTELPPEIKDPIIAEFRKFRFCYTLCMPIIQNSSVYTVPHSFLLAVFFVWYLLWNSCKAI
jgi:hypothetical protein